ncbi:MAG TPA: HAMP domain-containing sensor histidine kinase [Actinomycetota bacterium]|nr:HAMP domain-containing sensor histidine kinase [Actinomycetota bacterium]
MNPWRRLRTRLFASHLLVIAVGAVAVLAVAVLLTPSLFQSRVGRMGRGPGGMAGATSAELHRALTTSLDIALEVGLGTALIAAGAIAAVLGDRILRPIEAVRGATHRLASGDYGQHVPIPDEEELAGLAEDVNALGLALAETEGRRARLIGEVAHELRSPLTTIRASMEGLIDGVLEPTVESFAAIADEAGRLERLADDLTLLSQAEERAIPLHLEPNDLGELAARAAERLRPQFDLQGVGLKIEPGPSLSVHADRDRIAQVLTNLLGNALTHTPPGGTVTVRGGIHGSTAWVEVADTGAGIPPAELERIFDRFYRVPDPNHPAGRGIGLTIARGIARAHGGDVTAASDGPGTGAIFRVTIPVDRQARG